MIVRDCDDILLRVFTSIRRFDSPGALSLQSSLSQPLSILQEKFMAVLVGKQALTSPPLLFTATTKSRELKLSSYRGKPVVPVLLPAGFHLRLPPPNSLPSITGSANSEQRASK